MYNTIHETSIADIAANIKDGLKVVKGALPTRTGVAYSGSLTKATKGLVMEFPVLVSKANHIESAGIVAKAYEAKFVTLLQLAFAASNITNAKEGIDFVKNFHTNLNDKMSVDDFIDIMDHYVKESTITSESYAQFKAVTEDLKNLSNYFGEDISENALKDYKVMNNYGSLKVIKEYNNGNNGFNPTPHNSADLNRAQIDKLEKEKELLDKELQDYDANQKLKTDKDEREKDKLKLDKDRHDLDKDKFEREMITNNILSSDIKKANELVPTMMVVNFIYQEDGSTAPAVMRQMIIGVKAKLYEVEPMDVINKILTKYTDTNVLLKLVQVSTRQISFVKDFLLAIDDAKLDALTRSKRGSSNKLFKVLERRAVKGKIRNNLNIKNISKAISSLVISQEEAEELLKRNIDVSNPSVIRPIMEKLNLISFAIIDESSESVKFIYDTGDDVFETIPLSKLEREQRDGMSKKVINLMAKLNR